MARIKDVITLDINLVNIHLHFRDTLTFMNLDWFVNILLSPTFYVPILSPMCVNLVSNATFSK